MFEPTCGYWENVLTTSLLQWDMVIPWEKKLLKIDVWVHISLKIVHVIGSNILFIQWISEITNFNVTAATNLYSDNTSCGMVQLIETIPKLWYFYTTLPKTDSYHGIIVFVSGYLVEINHIITSFDAIVYLDNCYVGETLTPLELLCASRDANLPKFNSPLNPWNNQNVPLQC